MEKPIEELLTVEEVAGLLKIQPYTVREWAKSGTLKGRKYGRLWRFTREDLQDFLDGAPQPHKRLTTGDSRRDARL